MNVLKQIIENQRKRIILQIVLFALAFGVLFVTLYATPYHYDDTLYMKKWESEQLLESVSDIVFFQLQHYLNWGGRTVAHTIAQLLFLSGPLISSFLTTIVYFLTAFLVVKNSTGRCGLTEVMVVSGLLYYLNPIFDETVLWITGTANYLWTACIILAALLPVSAYLRNDEFRKSSWYFLPLAFLAGWCNENMSPIVFLLYAFAAWESIRRKADGKAYYLSASLLCAIGNALLLLAPGNYVRSDSYSSGIMGIMYRGHGQVNAWCTWLFPIVFLLVIVFAVCKKESLRTAKVYLLAGLGSVLVMAASPTFPSRATMGSLCLLLIPLMEKIDRLSEEHRTLLHIAGILLILGFAGSMTSIAILQIARNIGYAIPG